MGMNRSEQLQRQIDMDYAMVHQRTAKEFRDALAPDVYDATQNKVCDYPGSGAHLSQWSKGVYTCKASCAPVFLSMHKFDAGNGFVNFYDCVPGSVKIVDTCDTRDWPDAGVDAVDSNSSWDTDVGRRRPCQEVYDAASNSFLGYRF